MINGKGFLRQLDWRPEQGTVCPPRRYLLHSHRYHLPPATPSTTPYLLPTGNTLPHRYLLQVPHSPRPFKAPLKIHGVATGEPGEAQPKRAAPTQALAGNRPTAGLGPCTAPHGAHLQQPIHTWLQVLAVWDLRKGVRGFTLNPYRAGAGCVGPLRRLADRVN